MRCIRPLNQPDWHFRSSFEKISQSLQTIFSNFPSCRIISAIRGRAGKNHIGSRFDLDGFVLPFSPQIYDLPAKKEGGRAFCNLILLPQY